MEFHVVANVTSKTALSMAHVLAASEFARKAAEIEDTQHGLPWPQPNWEEVRSNVIAAVILSVAALEARVNELYLDAVDRNPHNIKGISEQQCKLLEELWGDVEKKSILDKWRIALSITGYGPVDFGREPFQSTSALVSLRNALVHAKPEWSDQLKQHRSLEKRLSSYFKPSRLTTKSFGSMSWFPNRCLGSGCAAWSVETIRSFEAEVAERMGVKCFLGGSA